MVAMLSSADLQRVALHKAQGHAWAFIADQTKIPLDVLERVPWTQTEGWEQTLAVAERLLAREMMSEMAHLLRGDLQRAEGKDRTTIVNSLTRVLKLQLQFQPRPTVADVEEEEPAATPPAALPSPSAALLDKLPPLPPLPPLDPILPTKPTMSIKDAEERLRKRPPILETLTTLFFVCCMVLGLAVVAAAPLEMPNVTLLTCEGPTTLVATSEGGLRWPAESIPCRTMNEPTPTCHEASASHGLSRGDP